MRLRTFILAMGLCIAAVAGTAKILERLPSMRTDDEPDTVMITGYVRRPNGTGVAGISMVECWTDRDGDGDYDLRDFAVNQNEEPLCWRDTWRYLRGPGVGWEGE